MAFSAVQAEAEGTPAFSGGVDPGGPATKIPTVVAPSASPPLAGSDVPLSGEKAWRIAEGWYAHTAFLLMLGAGPEIVATVATPREFPWMFHLFPALEQVRPLRAGQLEPETLLKLQSSLVFLPRAEAGLQPVLTREGMKTVTLGFQDFAGLLNCLKETEGLVATPLAAQRVQRYSQALQAALTAGGQPTAERPRVLHLPSLKPLQVDGAKTIISQWIEAGGGRNAATVTGNHRPVTAEQIVAWDPDILILGANAGSLESLRRDPVLGQLRAVRARRVFRNPSGVFLWDRYGPELLLQLFWARQVISRGRVDEADMTRRIMAFYREFYGVSLSPAEAARILAAQPPRSR
ncbi:iron ABC transporter substrate-binding protein [Oecophyllibacter saccharovorans]|uniref:Iron ABC transporter substrate-binding protein n=1 Tax=Oecophyllibacter saccharovorans TaxID=2558360 RepID=A0A506ULE8_9PROT|nr:iron ABC transporter substrate-binding protein [Oecophyllibacter saccharovorans]